MNTQTTPATIADFAAACKPLNSDEIYDLFETQITQELRDEIYDLSAVDCNEPARDALNQIGNAFGVQSLINY